MNKTIKWARRRKKKKVSKKLKRFLMKHKLGEIYQALRNASGSNNYFCFSTTMKSKIGYLKGSRIPNQSDKLFDKEYRSKQGFHTTVGKLISDQCIDNSLMQKVSALLYVRDFKLMKGLFLTSEIARHYRSTMYAPEEIGGSGGALWGSCMRGSSFTPAIRLYESFGHDVVQLLVLMNDSGEVMGRALFWKEVDLADGTKTEYLDRIYALNDNVKEAFVQFAECKGIRYYDDYAKKLPDFMGSVNVNIDHDVAVPYFDTFVGYSDGEITTDSGDYDLQLTDGQSLGGNLSQCEHCGREYDAENCGGYTEDTNQSVCDDCYVCCSGSVYLIDNCVEIGYRWYAKEDDDIVHSDYLSEYIMANESVWSDYHESYLLEKDSLCTINDKWYSEDDVGNDVVLTEDSGEYYEVDDDDIVQVNDEWYEKDYGDVVEICENWFHIQDDDIVEIDGEYYEMDDEDIGQVNDKWYHIDSDEVVRIKGKWYDINSNELLFNEAEKAWKIKPVAKLLLTYAGV